MANIKFTNVLDIPGPRDTNLPDFIPPIENGWLPNLPDSDYFRLPKNYYSSTVIAKSLQDKSGNRVFEYIRRYTPALQQGSLIHCMVLEPDAVHLMQDKIDDISVRFPEKIINSNIIPSAMEVVTNCVDAMLGDREITSRLDGATKEYAGVLTGSYRGGNVRIKADALSDERGVLYDVKTTSKSIDKFRDSLNDPKDPLGYCIQAALYTDVANRINSILGIPARYHTFEWLVVNKKSYETGVIQCGREQIERGLVQVKAFYKKKLKKKYVEVDYD